MSTFKKYARAQRFWVLAAALLASACGGGGGGGGSTTSSGGGAGGSSNPPTPAAPFTLAVTSVTQTRSVLDVAPVVSEILVTIPDAAALPFGLGGRYSDAGLASVIYDPETPKVTIYFKVPAGVAPGTHTDTITLGACEDADCGALTAGTTRTITAAYTITPATLPSYTLSTSEINVSALAGDVTPQAQVDVLLSVTNPAPFTPSGQSTSTTTNGVYSVEYSASSFAPLRFVITLKTPNSLAPGTYTDTVTVRMCLYIEYDCQNPLTVTPSTITVNYTITDTVPGPTGYTVRRATTHANDAAWDSTREVLYLSVPGNALERAATITEFNPATGEFGASVPAGTEPNLLAISDDHQFLYVADSALAEVRRFTLGPLTPDITIPLGNDTQHPSGYPHVAHDLKVAPGQPHVIAVQRRIPQFSPGNRGIVVFDDTVPRTTVWNDGGPYLQWSGDATRLYTNNSIAAVDANGVTPLSGHPAISGSITLVGNRLFGAVGEVTDVVTAEALGPIELDGYFRNITSDKALGRIYLLTNSRTNIGKTQIESYDASTLTRIGIGPLPQFEIQSNWAARATRFGANGLAIVTESKNLVLVTGPLIAP